VGAIDENLRVASFSSRGFELDLVAPGVSILSTQNNGQYAEMSGTSMAASHVTGAFASLKTVNPRASNEELSGVVFDTATPMGSKNIFGHGLINLTKAAIALESMVESVDPEESDDAVGMNFQENMKTKYEQFLVSIYRNSELGAKLRGLLGGYMPQQSSVASNRELKDLEGEEIDEALLDLAANEWICDIELREFMQSHEYAEFDMLAEDDCNCDLVTVIPLALYPPSLDSAYATNDPAEEATFIDDSVPELTDN
jgi:hypothetical protein